MMDVKKADEHLYQKLDFTGFIVVVIILYMSTVTLQSFK